MKTKILKVGLTVTMSAIMLLSNLNITNVFASVNSESMDVSTTDSMVDTLPAAIRDNYSYEIGPDGNKYIVYDNNVIQQNSSN